MRLIIKMIERWYEKLQCYDWHWHFRQRFTFVEFIVFLAAFILILDWLIRGDV